MHAQIEALGWGEGGAAWQLVGATRDEVHGMMHMARQIARYEPSVSRLPKYEVQQ